jgi:ferric-dicitrate binding protein FerR (iron transport regulator)
MARTASPTHREQLETMAATWTQLAEARKRQMEKQGRTEEHDRPPRQ